MLTVALSIFNYFIFSNQQYFKQHFTYEQAYSHSAVLISRIQGIEGYSFDKEIVMVGRPYVGLDMPSGIPEFDYYMLTGIIAFNQMFTNPLHPLFPYNQLTQLLRQLHNFTQDMTHLPDGRIDDPEIAAILAETPQYPNDGSIIIIDDRIFVNFAFSP